MLLSRKEVFMPTAEQQKILDSMGYAAYKLWNVANYEKRNYKEMGMEKFPDWYDQKKRLKENFFYKNLPSQTAQDVLQQLQEAWKSFFTLQKTGGVQNPRPPRFRKDKMDITFLKDAIRQENHSVRLTIPKQLKQYLKEQGVDANYLYLKTKRFSDIQIRELQIKFSEGKYTAIAVYEEKDVPLMEENGHYLSIDLGIKNTMACYDSNGKTFLLNGYLNITHYYDKKIAYYQGIRDSQQSAMGIQYPKKSARVCALYKKKKDCVVDYIHKATRYVADYCHQEGIATVVIGDIKGIRKDKNIGRLNQQLHALPYAQLIQKLEYKLRRYGIRLICQKESYSSQCSPHSEKVDKHCAQKGNRKSRGLYMDGKQIYNADCVGAYNILRLYLQEKRFPFPEVKELNSPVKVSV
ncbi:MAG: transposase [Roseburia sp.]|nr:transposase [Roseburia sp.]